MAGINAPYEEPSKPEIVVNTHVQTPEQCVNQTMSTLARPEYLPEGLVSAYTPDEEEMIRQQRSSLGTWGTPSAASL